jgi:hypothetical protein
MHALIAITNIHIYIYAHLPVFTPVSYRINGNGDGCHNRTGPEPVYVSHVKYIYIHTETLSTTTYMG